MRRSVLLSAVLVIALAACGGDRDTESTTSGPVDPAAFARPGLLADLPLVTLEAPALTGAGPAPEFRWTAVDGAASYRLSVRGPDGQAWAWRGAGTSIRYGGVEEGAQGPRLVPGMVWSVAAMDGSGAVVALSELRSVSPTDDPGPIGQTLGGSPLTAAAAAVPSATPDPALTDGPCTLLTTEEITAAFGGEWGEGVLGDTVGITGNCDWESSRGKLLTVWVLGADAHDPEGWGATSKVQGLDDGYYVGEGWDRRIGWVHGDYSVMLVTAFKPKEPEKLAGLAAAIEGRLP